MVQKHSMSSSDNVVKKAQTKLKEPEIEQSAVRFMTVAVCVFWNLVIQLFLIYPLFVEYFHRRFPKLYIDLKKNLSKFFLVFPADKNFKRYLYSIKNKDWDYVKYRTIIFTGSWLIAITIIVLIFVFVSWWY